MVYDGLPDDELIKLIDGGRSKDAVTVLIMRYLRLVRKKARAFSQNYADMQDLSQEGLLALLKAAGTYNGDCGAPFSAYAEVCVGNRLKTEAAKLKKHRVTDAGGLWEETADSGSPESVVIEREFKESVYKKLSALLSEREWSVFRLYLEDMSYAKIAQTLNIPEKSVDNAVYRVRRKLKSLIVNY